MRSKVTLWKRVKIYLLANLLIIILNVHTDTNITNLSKFARMYTIILQGPS